MMGNFVKFSIFFILFLAAAQASLGQSLGLKYPNPPGPEFDEQVRTRFTDQVVENKPQFVLLGDSVLRDSIDQDLLRELTGSRMEFFDLPGSASAFWYLIFKNNLDGVQHLPEYLIIFFRDTMLTTPDFRVTGDYLPRLDEFAGVEEPLLLELAYIQPMTPLERLMEAYLPLYGAREQLYGLINGWAKTVLPARALGCSPECVEQALTEIFAAPLLDEEGLELEVGEKENYLYEQKNTQFAGQLEQSFLPEIIRISQENGMQLIMVRAKTTRNPTREETPPELLAYLAELEAYLAENDIIFMDYGFDDRVLTEWYKDPVHIRRSDRVKFTEIFAADLMSLLGKKPATPVECDTCDLKHATPQPE